VGSILSTKFLEAVIRRSVGSLVLILPELSIEKTISAPEVVEVPTPVAVKVIVAVSEPVFVAVLSRSTYGSAAKETGATRIVSVIIRTVIIRSFRTHSGNIIIFTSPDLL
jgi:hypothetical protein